MVGGPLPAAAPRHTRRGKYYPKTWNLNPGPRILCLFYYFLVCPQTRVKSWKSAYWINLSFFAGYGNLWNQEQFKSEMFVLGKMVNGKVCVFLTNVLCKSGKLLIIILETHFMMLWYKKRLVLTVDCQLSATVSSRWWWTKIYFITWLNIQYSVGAHSWWGPEERCYHKIFQCSLSAVSGAWCDCCCCLRARVCIYSLWMSDLWAISI